MSNPFFRFKQFIVYHDKCAMKVGTDGVLLGGWTNPENAATILDIGTGTGLIALMMAQKTNNTSRIDAIDIDEDAIIQAKENSERSGFEKINCVHQSLQQYALECKSKYDLIISNPPYFTSSLHSPDKQRTVARHTNHLDIDELMHCSYQLLSEKGRLSLIYPHNEKNKLISVAEKNKLYVSKITNVFSTPQSEAKRILIEFSVKKECFSEDNLIIETARHIYSPEFIEMVKDFYLKL